MQLHSDYKDLLKILNKHKVRYLIIGAYAVIYYTEPRYTKDMDILVEPTANNAEKVYAALKEFGAPLTNMTPKDFTKKTLVYQMGVAPVRVDILMALQGVEFNSAWENKTVANFEQTKVYIIGKKELLTAKKNTKRNMDKIDVSSLKKALNG